MRTCSFQSVLQGVARLLGLDVTRDLTVARAASLTEYINTRVKEGWEFDFWPEWTAPELRQYRQAWNAGTAYTAPASPYVVGSGPIVATEVWSPTFASSTAYCDLQYVQALQPSTNQPPFSAAGVINDAYWALAASNYNAANWQPNTNYPIGAAGMVFDPVTLQFYQCYIPHTSGATMDYTKFGALKPFDRYVAYQQPGQNFISRVKFVSVRDPSVATRNPGKIPFRTSTNGVQVNIRAPGQVWVTFCGPEPVFTTIPWSSTFAYTGSGELVYVASPLNAAPNGNCYTSSAAGTNLPPATNPDSWDLVEFPLVISSYVKRAAFSDGLRELKQQDRATLEEQRAKDELSDAVDREIQSQAGSERATADTYGSGH